MATSKKSPPLAALPAEGGRRQRRAAETRIKIFRAAMQLFAEQGPANVTVEQITQAADVGKGTFFNYFESKEHVLGVLAEIQLAKVKEALELAADGRRSAYAILRRLVRRVAEEPGRSPEMARAMLTTFLAGELIRSMINGFLDEARSEIARIIVYGQERGEIAPELNPARTARELQRALFGTILFWSLRGEPSLATSAEECFQHFWRAIGVSE